MLFTCPVCQRQFEAARAKVYCSRECYYRARGIREGRKPIKTCRYCGKEFQANKADQRYCSKECMLKGIYREKHPMVERICATCGMPFQTSSSVQRYCSARCRKRQRDRRYHDKIRFSGNREPVLEQANGTCVVCGSTTANVVHHVDLSGQSENRNDSLPNLVPVCRACHRRIHPEVHRKRIDPQVTTTCATCGKEFVTTEGRLADGQGKYCSRACKDRAEGVPWVKMTCQHCGKEFEVLPSRARRGKVKYCGMECRIAAGYAWTR